MKQTETEAKVEYPCDMPIKVVGMAVPEFETAVLEITQAQCCDFDGKVMKRNQSSTGKYNSLTLMVTIQSSEHLDTYYKALGDCEHVKWAM